MKCALEQELLDIKDQVEFLKDKRKVQKTNLDVKEKEFWKFREETGKDFNTFWESIWAYNPYSNRTKIEAKIKSLEGYFLLKGKELKDLRPKVGKGKFLSSDYEMEFHKEVVKELKGMKTDPKFDQTQKSANEVKNVIDAISKSSLEYGNKEITIDDIIHIDVVKYKKDNPFSNAELVNKILKGEEKSSALLDADPGAIDYINDLYSSIKQQIKDTSIQEIQYKEFGGNPDSFGKALVKRINEDKRMEGENPLTFKTDIHKYVNDTLEHVDPSVAARSLMEMRGVASAVYLTTSVFNVIGDIGTALASAGQLGTGTQLKLLKNLKLSNKERLEIQRFGNFVQEIGNSIHRGVIDDGVFSTSTQVAAQTTQKYSGVEFFTNKMREAAWATITQEHLSAARKGDLETLNTVFPDDLSKEFISKVPEEWSSEVRNAFAAGIEQEAESWVIMYGAKARSFASGKPGSVPNEVLKVFTQFLPFVFQMGVKVSEKTGKMDNLGKLKYASQLLAFGMITTMIGDTLRDIANNRTPRILPLLEGKKIDQKYITDVISRTSLVSPFMMVVPSEWSGAGLGGTPAFSIPVNFVMTLSKASSDIVEGKSPDYTLWSGARKITPNLPIPFVSRFIGDSIEELVSPSSYHKRRIKYNKRLRKNHQDQIFDF